MFWKKASMGKYGILADKLLNYEETLSLYERQKTKFQNFLGKFFEIENINILRFNFSVSFHKYRD
jgi:hypothetical protein